MTKQEALQKIKELQDYISQADSCTETNRERAVELLKENLRSINTCRVACGYIWYGIDGVPIFEVNINIKKVRFICGKTYETLSKTLNLSQQEISQLLKKVCFPALNCSDFTVGPTFFPSN